MSNDKNMSSSTNATPAPDFISLEAAAAMTTGTRVTFIPGVPALYSEALKNICFVKGINLIRVLHPMLGCRQNHRRRSAGSALSTDQPDELADHVAQSRAT